jgi:N-acetylmuramoyl-L-alanine amidase
LRTRAKIVRQLIAVFLAAATWVGIASATATVRPVLLDASLAERGDVVTLTLRLSDPVDFRILTLPSPNRLVIDLPPLDWLTPPAHLKRFAARSRSIDEIRYGWFRPGTYRIVLDLAQPVVVSPTGMHSSSDAYTLAISWRRAGTFAQQSLGSYINPPLPPGRPPGLFPAKKPLIVIDPGHGGVDPGAIGQGGTKEKDVTLAAAQLLAARLQAEGHYRVKLTRTDDRFLRLSERREVARRAGADLFLSLHADSAPGGHVRGLSVYTLSERASDAEAAALARSENKADMVAGLHFQDENEAVVSILIDLAQRETMNHSIRFANNLVQAAATRVPVVSRAHRHAGFAVLKAPGVPSVLVELGFLSNREEEHLLNTKAHLSLVAEGIALAIDNFFGDRIVAGQ